MTMRDRAAVALGRSWTNTDTMIQAARWTIACWLDGRKVAYSYVVKCVRFIEARS